MYSNSQLVTYPNSRPPETFTISIPDFAFMLYKDKLINIEVKNLNVIYFKTNKTTFSTIDDKPEQFIKRIKEFITLFEGGKYV
jgi:hypothetical protein